MKQDIFMVTLVLRSFFFRSISLLMKSRIVSASVKINFLSLFLQTLREMIN